MSGLRFVRRQSLWKGAVAGLCGGLAGTIVMTLFQSGWGRAARLLAHDQQEESTPHQSGEASENATMKAASKLASVTGRELSFDEKKRAGLAVHYTFGAAMGGIYGAAAELSPRFLKRRPALSGSIFGSTLFIGADEVAVPKLGLSSGQAPLSSHLYGLASHLTYGLTAGLIHSVVRKNL